MPRNPLMEGRALRTARVKMDVRTPSTRPVTPGKAVSVAPGTRVPTPRVKPMPGAKGSKVRAGLAAKPRLGQMKKK